MNYNMTTFTEANNILGQFASINTLTGNWLVQLMLISVFLVLLFSLMSRNPPQESFAAASTVTTLVSLFGMIAGLVNIEWVVGFSVIWAFSLIALYNK